MFVDWLNFKSCLGNSSDKTLVYIDDEGSEIPIENECEFIEAVKLAKLNKKRLKLIFYYEKSNKSNPLAKNQCQYSDILSLNSSLETSKDGTIQENSVSKEKCQCIKNAPPDWFIHHMKKIKKEILHKLQLSTCNAVQNVEKGNDLSCKIETASAAITIQIKKKKKRSEKDLGDFLDQREIKLAKKNEKLHSKFDILEKFDSKTRLLLEEKVGSLERKYHLKQKFDKSYGTVSERDKLKKSASFHKNEVCVFLPPNAEFVITLNFTNNGSISWEAPWLECFDFNGLCPKDVKMCLPRLLPMESGFITLRGKVSEHRGFHHFKCRLFDGLQKIGPEFTCWAKVDASGSVKKIPNAVVNGKESHERKNEDPVGILNGFDKDEFAATKKKIENIYEIQRRLQDIDLLYPSTSLKDKVKNNAEDLKMAEDFKKTGYDSTQNLERKEKNWKEKLQQDGVHFGLDCLQLSSPNNEEMKKQQGNKFVKSALEAKAESDKQRPLESFKTDTAENNEVLSTSKKHQRRSASLRKRRPCLEVLISNAKKIKPVSSKYHFTTANLTQPTFIQIPEDFLERRPKFTFTGDKKEQKCPEGVFLKRSSKHIPSEGGRKEEKGLPDYFPEGSFSKGASQVEKKENISVPKVDFYSPLKSTSAKSKEVKVKVDDFKIRTVDASGKIIYAVNDSGHCFPVGSLPKNFWTATDDLSESVGGRDSGNSEGSERRYDHFNELPSSNVNALVNRASNVASIALNTAKFVINNLHSAFVPEARTELGKPAYENQKREEALLNLSEMGFTDFELNQRLLRIHENDVRKVVDDLIQMQTNSSGRNA